MTLWLVLVLGLVEGLTEFLPVSSTGHLILVWHQSGLPEGPRAEVFEIFIQLGAILAVVLEYRNRLWAVVRELPRDAAARGFALNVGLAFVPAAAIGFFTHKAITEHLFSPRTVAAALVAGAIAILAVESLPLRPATSRPESITWRQSLVVGLAQCISLWPGFSRSAATILGGMGAGLDRRAATEFSFFLAIPTLGAATVYSLLKNAHVLAPGDLGYLAVAFAVSFVVAWATIRWLLRYVATHTLRPFAWYRIALGVVVFWLMR